MTKKVELLSPCGGFDRLQSAISAGCDAVYLAGKRFGARAFADNFDDEEIINAIKLCHLYNVKVYVTINTIIYEDEIDDAVKYVDFLYLNGVDAIIIQDLGLASILHNRYSDLPLHASTQVNCQTVEDCIALKKLGFSRIILGREVSIDIIKEIREKVDIEIEVFVHGALCVSYSGNCFVSSLEGGRSGNRGRCAQICRLKHQFNGEEKYYLSPKDLSTISFLEEIYPYVDSLKIEGRMKSKEYVYYVTKAYKQKIMGLNYQDDLEKSKIAFNRMSTKGFILNESNDDLVNFDSCNHLGVLIGKVVDYIDRKGSIFTSLICNQELQVGDSLRITSNESYDAVIVNEMYVDNKLVKKTSSGEKVYIKLHKKMKKGSLVYITKREENDFSLPKIEITGKCYIDFDKNLCLEISDGKNIASGICQTEISEKNFEETFKTQILKTGSTPFLFSNLDVNAKNYYVSIKEINALRRDLLCDLQKMRENKYNRKTINTEEVILSASDNTHNYKEYSIIVSNEKQLEKVLSVNKDIDFELYFRNKLQTKGRYVLPRVNNNKNYDYNCVSSSIGKVTEVSSVYMNVVNSYTIRVLEHLGFSKIGLSIELSKENIIKMLQGYKSRYHKIPKCEVMVYGYYQLMYMKYCLVNKTYNEKKLHCQRCHKERLMLSDHPLFGDELCHMSLLSKNSINLSIYLKELKEIGISSFLYDYTIETEEEIKKLSEYNEFSLSYGFYKK